ncbi:MAG: Two-component hybrid sensor and regulator, partial [Cyanobacteria bacterium RYN_339]|nr:Two-component hybrid sensor and regulator [Cyanobacteria bacterium RYN_339]
FRPVLSPGAFAIFGRPPTASGEPDFDLVAALHPDDRAKVRATCEELGREGQATSLDFRLVRPGGEVRQVRAHVVARRQPRGGVSGAEGTLMDVTASQELPRMRDELLAIIGHELRTPLTAILMPVQLLAHGLVDPSGADGKQMLDLAHRNAERLARLVHDATLYERLAHGRLALRVALHNAKSVAADALATAQLHAEPAGVKLALVAEPLAVKADADRLQLVLEHLLENAIVHSPPGATVTLTVRAEGDRVRFEVEDHGPGVAPKVRQEIYELFRQADSTISRRHRGIGLGLALGLRLARLHGGDLWHEDPPTGGARFVLALPRGHGSQTG